MQDNKQLEEILSDSEQVKFTKAVAYLFNVEMEYDNENKIADRIKIIQKYMVEQESALKN